VEIPYDSIRIMIISTAVRARAHAYHVPRFRHLIVSIRLVISEMEYTLRRAGAILFVSVPATIITSLCLGLARNTIPYVLILASFQT
jgi:hypothetical protein